MPKSKSSHKCLTNHIGSAGAGKVSGAIHVFRRSITIHNLMYPGTIGNSNTKAHQSVVEASPYDQVKTEKPECVGRVQKQLGTRLRGKKGAKAITWQIAL